MDGVVGFLRSVYDFFIDDGSIALGALAALLIVGVISGFKLFAHARDVAGPLLFGLIVILLATNLWRSALRARRR